jgi:hypothetical protein
MVTISWERNILNLLVYLKTKGISAVWRNTPDDVVGAESVFDLHTDVQL